jgi:hypothetical protein
MMALAVSFRSVSEEAVVSNLYSARYALLRKIVFCLTKLLLVNMRQNLFDLCKLVARCSFYTLKTRANPLLVKKTYSNEPQ